MYRFLAILSLSLPVFTSCKKSNSNYGYVRFVFEHYWDDEPIKIDATTPYVNAAGNVVTFSNLEYFISDLTVRGHSSTTFDNPLIRYLTNDSVYSTMLLTHRVPVGPYQSVTFTFGIDDEKNESNLFPNSPQKDMFWPENMGGGYHCMKIDGKWKNTGDTKDQGFGLHLGHLKKIQYDTIWNQKTIERIDTINQKFYGTFSVVVPKNFDIGYQEITTVKVIMDVKKWMEGTYTWDFNQMGGATMSSEKAMDSLVRNGRNVFR